MVAIVPLILILMIEFGSYSMYLATLFINVSPYTCYPRESAPPLIILNARILKNHLISKRASNEEENDRHNHELLA